VHVGDTVTWVNEDNVPHTVTTTGGPTSFDSGTMNKGETYSHTFTSAGTWSYYCAVHPDMKGTVVVTDDASTSTTAPPTSSPKPDGTPSGDGPGGMGDGMGPGQGASPPTDSPSAAPAPSAGSGNSGGTGTCSGQMVMAAALEPFWVHFDHAHLEEGPAQQAGDLLNPNQYVKTHTVLFEAMLAPLIALSQDSMQGVDPFFVHFNHAHLEESPAQQAADLGNTNQYVKTHTVLVEQMSMPAQSSIEGTSGC